jgi:hypothetical protein
MTLHRKESMPEIIRDNFTLDYDAFLFPISEGSRFLLRSHPHEISTFADEI